MQVKKIWALSKKYPISAGALGGLIFFIMAIIAIYSIALKDKNFLLFSAVCIPYSLLPIFLGIMLSYANLVPPNYNLFLILVSISTYPVIGAFVGWMWKKKTIGIKSLLVGLIVMGLIINVRTFFFIVSVME